LTRLSGEKRQEAPGAGGRTMLNIELLKLEDELEG